MLHIVTGCDSSHARSACNLIASVQRHEADARITLYDLGLAAPEHAQIAALIGADNIKKFAFEAYPDYFDITRNAGEYAWKPVLFGNEVAAQEDGLIFWMDAGNLLLRSLRKIKRLTRKHGVYLTDSSATMDVWTHPDALAYFGLDIAWARGKTNIASGLVGVDVSHPQSVALMQDWAKYAQVRDAIAPPGSSRANHRQDQALLGMLVYKAGLLAAPLPRKRLGLIKEISFHNDVEGIPSV